MRNGQRYLRRVQYRGPARLAARAFLHNRYGRGDWHAWLAAHLPLAPGDVVADVGCGAASFWSGAPPTVPDDLRLRLFDISPGMAEAARAALRARKRWPDTTVAVADAVALPMREAGADTVMAVHMLYHLADPAAGLAEMARVTRGGGTVAVVLNPAGTMAELSAVARAALGEAAVLRREPLTSEQGLRLMRERFARVDVVRYADELRVTDPGDLLAYLCSLPYADAAGAPAKLATAVAEAFDRSHGVFTVAKASEVLLGRR